MDESIDQNREPSKSQSLVTSFHQTQKKRAQAGVALEDLTHMTPGSLDNISFHDLPLSPHIEEFCLTSGGLCEPLFSIFLEKIPRTWKILPSTWPLVAVLCCGYRSYIEDVGCRYLPRVCSSLPLPYSCFPQSRSWYFDEINPTNISFSHGSCFIQFNDKWLLPQTHATKISFF